MVEVQCQLDVGGPKFRRLLVQLRPSQVLPEFVHQLVGERFDRCRAGTGNQGDQSLFATFPPIETAGRG